MKVKPTIEAAAIRLGRARVALRAATEAHAKAVQAAYLSHGHGCDEEGRAPDATDPCWKRGDPTYEGSPAQDGGPDRMPTSMYCETCAEMNRLRIERNAASRERAAALRSLDFAYARRLRAPLEASP